jgi:micrococcal nuclease
VFFVLLCTLLVYLVAPKPAIPVVAAATLPAGLQAGVVTKVVDGDTLHVRIGTTTITVRLIGIDTPEVVDPRKPVQCYGREASVHMHLLVDAQIIYLQADASQGNLDKYGRALRFVWLADGTNVNQHMIADGYAFEYTYRVPYQYQSQFRTAQADAHAAQRGLWSPTTCNGEVTTPAATPMRTSTVTRTASVTRTDTLTRTASVTRTSTVTRTASATRTSTMTRTASATATGTLSGSITAASAPCIVNDIKGNIHSLIYHVPSGLYYATTHVSVRCFVTEQDAILAGYRRSQR